MSSTLSDGCLMGDEAKGIDGIEGRFVALGGSIVGAAKVFPWVNGSLISSEAMLSSPLVFSGDASATLIVGFTGPEGWRFRISGFETPLLKSSSFLPVSSRRRKHSEGPKSRKFF